MFSFIVCCNDNSQLDSYYIPSVEMARKWARDNNLPEIESLVIRGSSSISKSYNYGIKIAKYPIKIFIHQDVHLLNSSWIPKLFYAFSSSDVGLVGMVGTTKLSTKGFWWDSGEEYLRGELFSGLEKADWVFSKENSTIDVTTVDGFFMATNRSIPFDEGVKGFHFYDMDYSRTMLSLGLKVRLINHKAWHIGKIRDQDTHDLMEYFYAKWGGD